MQASVPAPRPGAISKILQGNPLPNTSKCLNKNLLKQEFQNLLGYLLIALDTHEILGVRAVGEERDRHRRVTATDVYAFHITLGRIAIPKHQTGGFMIGRYYHQRIAVFIGKNEGKGFFLMVAGFVDAGAFHH